MPMDDAYGGHCGSRQIEGMVTDAFHLHPETSSVRNDESQIANLRDIDAWMINLVEDPAADGEPQARSPE